MGSLRLITSGLAAGLVLLTAACNREAKVHRHLEGAERAHTEGDFNSADLEYRNVLQQEPGNRQALMGLGRLRLAQGAAFEAAALLRAAQTADASGSHDPELAVALGQALLAAGFIEDARALAVDQVEKAPREGAAWLLLVDTSLTPDAAEEAAERLRANPQMSGDRALAAATLHLRANELEQAAEELQKARETGADSRRSHELTGQLEAAQGNPQAAEAALREALAENPKRNLSLLPLVALLLAQDREAEADQLLDESLRLAPDFVPAWRLKGERHLANAELDQAEACFKKVLDRASYDVESGVLMARLWTARGQAKEAADLLERIRKVALSRPMLELALAQSYLANGDSPQALAALTRCLSSHPHMKEAVLLKARLDLSEGRSREAVDGLQAYLVRDPSSGEAQFLLIDAYRAQGRYDDAIAILQAQVKAAPEDYRPPFFLGLTQQAAGRLPEARAALAKAQELAPDPLLVFVQRVMLEIEDQQFEVARQWVEERLAQNTQPATAQLLYLRAYLAHREGQRLPEAVADLTKAVELAPQMIAAHQLLVQVHVRLGQASEAVARLHHLLEQTPDNVPAHLSSGALLVSLGRDDEARRHFEKCIALNSEFAPAYNELALLESQGAGNLERAQELAMKARVLLPADPAVADTLGWILFQRGAYLRAHELLREAANGLPNRPEVIYHLAEAQAAMGQSDEAISGLQRALATAPSFPERALVEARLADLEALDQLELGALEQRWQSRQDDLPVALHLANAYHLEQRYEDEAQLLVHVVQKNPQIHHVHRMLAELYGGPLQDPAKALDYARMAREREPHNPQVVAVLAKSAFAAGEHRWARDLYMEAARRLQDDSQVLRELAWAHYSIGDVPAARDAMEQALELDPAGSADLEGERFLELTAAAPPTTPAQGQDVPALMANGEFALSQGQPEIAIALFQQALDIYPLFMPAMIQMAEIYALDPTHLDEAKSLVSQLKEHDPDDPALDSLQTLIAYQEADYREVIQSLRRLSSRRKLTSQEGYLLGMSLAATEPMEAASWLKQSLEGGLAGPEKAKAESQLRKLEE